MNRSIQFFLALALFSSGRALGHITYTGRDFGTLTGGGVAQSATLSVTTISSDFGWAASTDADYGDSHRTRAFRFQLANAGVVTLSVQATTAGFLPGLSLYSGLAHTAPSAADHDSSQLTIDYLATLGGPAKTGALFGLGDWAIGNDPVYQTPGDATSGVAIPASLSYFHYLGNLADGSAANYGTAPGIQGDGLADGYITRSFDLPAGDYSVFLGGANLSGEGPPNPTYPNYGAIVTLGSVPEPSAVMLTACAVAAAGLRRRRK